MQLSNKYPEVGPVSQYRLIYIYICVCVCVCKQWKYKWTGNSASIIQQHVFFVKTFHRSQKPNIAVECLATLLHIKQVAGSDTSPENSYSEVPCDFPQDRSSKYDTDASFNVLHNSLFTNPLLQLCMHTLHEVFKTSLNKS